MVFLVLRKVMVTVIVIVILVLRKVVCWANIRIHSDIQILVSEYWIFEYEYCKFDFSNILVFVFGQKINIQSSLKHKYGTLCRG